MKYVKYNVENDAVNDYDNDAHSTLYHEPIRYLTHIFCVGAPKVYITPNVFIALHNRNRGGGSPTRTVGLRPGGSTKANSSLLSVGVWGAKPPI